MKFDFNDVLFIICGIGAVLGVIQDNDLKLYSFILYAVLISLRVALIDILNELKKRKANA